jgi:hypothetical protein
MAELESQRTTVELPGKPVPHDDATGIAAGSANRAQTPIESAEDRPAGGISIIPVPRRQIARLQGTLRLSSLPRHKPTIVFDPDRQLRDSGDE